VISLWDSKVYEIRVKLFYKQPEKYYSNLQGIHKRIFYFKGHVDRHLWNQLGEQGFLGVAIPAEVGGIGGTFKDEAIILEEQVYAHCHAPAIAVHSSIVMPYFANYGTTEQKEYYIPKMVSGEFVGAIGMTEPDAGSDLQGNQFPNMDIEVVQNVICPFYRNITFIRCI